jgi:DNA-binding Lrp family transcriptional regulator
LLNEKLKADLSTFEGQRPVLVVTNVMPSQILSYLNKSDNIKAALGRSNSKKFESILSYLHEFLVDAMGGECHIHSISDIASKMKLSVSSIRRTLEECEKTGLITKHVIQMKTFRFTTWELTYPNIHQESVEPVPVKTLPIRSKSEAGSDKQLLNWAENFEQQDSNMVLLYGKNIFKILQALFIKKADRKNALQSVQSIVNFNFNKIPATISCNVNSELPYSDDLIKYFSILECVEQSMRENSIRDPSSVLKKITYEVPINKIIEQLGTSTNSINRADVVKSIRRLEARIELSELPESEYLSGKENFISFQPLANVSVLKVKKLDRKTVTGDGVMIATFTLPNFIVNSLIQRVREGSFQTEELSHIQHTGLIEDLLELPSAWVKGRYDLLAATLLTVKSEQSQDNDGKYFTSWSKLHSEIESSRSPGTLKLAVCKLALKKGAKQYNSSPPKYVLSYRDVEATFDSDGVTISLSK